MDTVIDRARRDDAQDVFRLVEDNHLPLAGLADHLGTTLVARDGTRVVGSAALEVYAEGVLLRSVAVAEDRRGRGLGQALTTAAIRLAQEIQAPSVYLLTTTAERFFPRFGFQPIARSDVPAGVQHSIEFTSACPASATVMCKRL